MGRRPARRLARHLAQRSTWRTAQPKANDALTCSSVRLPDAEAGEARQHLVAEIRCLVEIVDERHRDAAHAGAGDVGQLLGDAVRGAYERIAADRFGRVILLLLRVDLR